MDMILKMISIPKDFYGKANAMKLSKKYLNIVDFRMNYFKELNIRKKNLWINRLIQSLRT